MAPKVFIDGDAGTTGLQIHARLNGRRDLELLAIDPARRKDAAARADMLNRADLVILCLPDEAAREAVRLIENRQVKVIDASTAHRVAKGWVFGFPESEPGQRAAIAAATRVSNPGCYSTGAIALLRPLVRAGLLPADWPVTINAVSGYSGGGRSMIAEFEDAASPSHTTVPYRIYATGLEHKHVPEIQLFGGLTRRPIFMPSVGHFRQGMLVSLPLYLDDLPGKPSGADLREALRAFYEGSEYITVAVSNGADNLEPDALNGTNRLDLYVCANEQRRHAVLVAQLDNLGKGASGAAVQNLRLMLGLDPRCN